MRQGVVVAKNTYNFSTLFSFDKCKHSGIEYSLASPQGVHIKYWVLENTTKGNVYHNEVVTVFQESDFDSLGSFVAYCRLYYNDRKE